MFVGHALLAFGLVGLAARRFGATKATAMRVAVLAALFAALPDVDIVYAVTGPLTAAGTEGLAESFWSAGNVLHRGATHSLVVGAVTACAVAAIATRRPAVRAAGGAALVALVAVVAAAGGALVGAVTALFAAGGAALALGARRYGLAPRVAGAAAFAGLWSHPFGDLLTGSPPALLYPFEYTVIAERVVLSADPTLHLLGAFAVELATVWLALWTYFRLRDRRLAAHVDRRAVAGVGYAGAAVALPAPTLDVSYHFVFSVLAVGAVGAAPPTRRITRARRALRSLDAPQVAATGLAAVTLATAVYAGVYVLL